VIVRHQRTGQDVILRCAVAPVRSETAIVGAVAVCTDITSHKKQDEERERLYRQARQAVADRQHVLEIVSHDLRTPLSSVAFAAATLGDDQMPAELRTHAAGALARGVDRMTRMISDLLDANSIEAGRLTVKPLPQDPVSIVEEVVELFAAQAVSRGVALAAEIRGVLPLVRGDRHRLIQALTNLVSNALKVTSEGSVTIAAESHGSEVIFGVTDTGPGIREEDRPRLFEPYWRAENAVYKGTGLGLAIVHGIVQAHGGRVWAETPAHRGAAILFSVPSA
jgi:signal transduction histidine kinase